MLKNLLRSSLLAVGILLSSTVSFAGSIITIDAKKKTVTIDEKLEKGSSVCFFNDKGKKMGCGKVSKAKGSESTIKVTKAKLKKLKEGMSALPEGVDPGAESTSVAGTTAKGSGKNPFAIKVLYILGVMPPATYNKLSYLKAPDTGNPSTLWQSGGKSGLSFIGGGGEVIVPLMKTFSIGVGGKFRLFSEYKTDSDYSALGNLHVLSTQTASSFGGWADFHYLRMPFSPSMGLRVGSGLDLEINSMTLKATRLDDQGKLAEVNVGEASSKVTTISVRLASAAFEMMFGNFGISAGAVLMLPLSASNTFSNAGDTADTNNANLAKVTNPDEDLKTALGHTKNSIGLDVVMGLMMAF